MLRPESTVLSLDWGLKKVGIATSDANGTVITPRPLWFRKPAGQIWSFNQSDKEDLKKIISQYEASYLILGEPRAVDNSETSSSLCAQKHAQKLSEFSGLHVQLIPEALSSWESRTHTSHNDFNEDSVAAALLIESFFREINSKNKGAI